MHASHGKSGKQVYFAVVAIAAALVAAPQLGLAEIIWSGSYEAGSFEQWHTAKDADSVAFFQIPEYGRPIQYGGQAAGHVGNGELLSLVAATERTINGVHYPRGPTRGSSEFAAKFTVKNSANGVEPDDCDNGVCNRRRTELTVQGTLPIFYNAIPYMAERWTSISIFVPSDWDDSGSSWGPMVYQIKPLIDGGGVGPTVSLQLRGGEWTVQHGWTDIANCKCQLPWQQRMNYTSSDTHKALIPDFPSQSASEGALALRKGTWTDWVMRINFDARGSKDGGKGVMDVWNRTGDGDWVHVLHIVPKVLTIGGMTFDRGIGHNAPPTAGSPGGFGIKAGMYMDTSQVWGLKNNRVIYNTNIKVGEAGTAFEEMSPDGSLASSLSGGGISPVPKPPEITD